MTSSLSHHARGRSLLVSTATRPGKWARKKILAAAKKFDIEVSEDDDVARGD